MKAMLLAWGRRAARRPWLFVALLPTLLFVTQHAPASTDMPEHTLAIGALRGLLLGDPAFTQSYEANLSTSPYLAYHVLGAALAIVVRDPDVANRVLLVAVALAFPLTFRRFLGALGADRRLVWFAVLPFFSRALAIGFLPFLFSVPVGFTLVAQAVEHARDVARGAARPWRRALGLSVLGVVLFYSHLSSLSMFAPTAALCAIVVIAAERGVRRAPLLAARALAWLAVPGVVAARFLLVGRLSAQPGAGLDDGAPTTMSVGRSLHALPLWVFDNFRTRVDDVFAAGYWLVFVAVATYSIVRALRGRAPIRALTLVPLLVAVVVYVATPFRVGAAVYLNVRLAPIVLLFALVPLRMPPSRWLARALGVVSLAGATSFAVCSRLCERDEAAGLAEIEAAIRPGSKVATLAFDRRSRATYIPPYLYPASVAVAKRGGAVSFSFASLPHWSIHYRQGSAPPPHRPFWVFRPCEFRNSVDGEHYDAVVVRGEIDPFASEPLGPAYVLTRRAGRYALYERDRGRRFSGPDRGPCPVRASSEATYLPAARDDGDSSSR